MAEEKALIKPEEREFDNPEKGKPKLKYIISNLSAVDARRVAAIYPFSALPKMGDYEENEKVFYLMMQHVEAVKDDGRRQRLLTKELIDNHVPTFEVLAALEGAMLAKNFSFFSDGRIPDLFDRAVAIFLSKVSEILTRSSEQLFPAAKQPSPNSGQSTTSKMPS